MRKLGWSDVTAKSLWLNRRQLIAGGAALAATPALAASICAAFLPKRSSS